MTRSTRWSRGFLYLSLLAAAVGFGLAGCGGEPPAPAAGSDQMKAAVEEREQIIQKEYGGGAPAKPKAKR